MYSCETPSTNISTGNGQTPSTNKSTALSGWKLSILGTLQTHWYSSKNNLESKVIDEAFEAKNITLEPVTYHKELNIQLEMARLKPHLSVIPDSSITPRAQIVSEINILIWINTLGTNTKVKNFSVNKSTVCNS